MLVRVDGRTARRVAAACWPRYAWMDEGAPVRLTGRDTLAGWDGPYVQVAPAKGRGHPTYAPLAAVTPLDAEASAYLAGVRLAQP